MMRKCGEGILYPLCDMVRKCGEGVILVDEVMGEETTCSPVVERVPRLALVL